MLERDSEALAKIPLMPGWMVLHSPEYRQYSEGFPRAVVDLSDAAKARDLDGRDALSNVDDELLSVSSIHEKQPDRQVERNGASRAVRPNGELPP
jgi:hypothetical protein